MVDFLRREDVDVVVTCDLSRDEMVGRSSLTKAPLTTSVSVKGRLATIQADEIVVGSDRYSCKKRWRYFLRCGHVWVLWLRLCRSG